MNRRTRLFGAGLLVAFWAGAAVPAALGAVEANAFRAAAEEREQTVDEVILALEAERRVSVAHSTDTALNAQRAETDEAVGRLRQAASGPATDGLSARLNDLPAVRASVDDGDTARQRIVTAYSEVISASSPADVVTADAGISALSRSREILAEEDALLAAAAAASAGPTPADRTRVARLSGARRALLTAAGGALPADATERHRQLSAGTAATQLTRFEDAFAADAGDAPDPAVWAPAFNELNTALWDLRDSAGDEVVAAATARAVTATVWAGTIGGVGFIALAGWLVVALRRRSAETAAPVPAAGPVRSGPRLADELLRDLGRRNQGLVQRQLRLLDAMARRSGDPETLADLRRAGEFAVRLRRNVEKDVTLTGGTPERPWSRLVAVDEIIQEAAAEIADHERVTATEVESGYLAGTAATDLTHLLAELIENATTFAPADSPVVVAGQHEPDGYLVTVSDIGPGMTDDDLATGHEMMAASEPPGAWWGLWAAGRFADRQKVVVRLHNNPDGGLTAAVLIPATVVTGRPDSLDTRTDLQAVTE
ncbi:nitrate- and nitrite sensing domain-containing protein [Actinoplanes sp. NBRC 101535]|uniref:sensor histidine kinase n=1 Tax=Actinoplanes sp. NBRC 101535 TaxID=3032196 RepID=UPI0024A09504|nr:nitrate- and nitrite sensing domain-containing protein [Actinoplanes sp. NBRC 101535]GLY05095.1 hypothetical protein Acsp01_54740 [Actinoplanes sp. NBRC 101535]